MKLVGETHTVCPAFDAALFDAEDEDGAAPDHGASLELVEATRYAGYEPTTRCLYKS